MNLDLFNTYDFWIMLLVIGVAGYLYNGIRALAVGLDEISKSMRVMEQRQKRLSATYMKIENDLVTLQKLVTRTAQRDQNTKAEIQEVFAGGEKRLAFLFENGPNQLERLRGLEFPDVDEDPYFTKNLRPETHSNYFDLDAIVGDADDVTKNGENTP